MKKTISITLLTILLGISHTGYAFAGTNPKVVHVKGYTTKSGKYVAPYVRTAPNKTTADNFGRRK